MDRSTRPPLALTFAIGMATLIGCVATPPLAEPSGPQRVVTEKHLATISTPYSFSELFWGNSWYPPRSLIVSPDGRHVAYVIRKSGNWAVVVDGVEGRFFQSIWRHSFQFSADSQHIAYVAEIDGNSCVAVVDEKAYPPADRIGYLAISPNGQRIVYSATKGDKIYCITDGHQGKAFEDIDAGPILSPDGRHVAYAAKSGEKDLLIVDDQPQASHDFIYELVYSPNGARLAYGATVGRPLPPWPGEPIEDIIYMMKHGGGSRLRKAYAVIDGTPGKIYDYVGDFVFSADGRRVAYKACVGNRWFAVIDGQEQKCYDGMGSGPIVFSPDGQRVAYVVRSGKNWAVVADGNEYPRQDVVNDPVFSPDSQRLAYAPREGRGTIVMVDGQCEKPYPDLATSMVLPCMHPVGLCFSPDSSHIAYWAPGRGKGGGIMKSSVVIDNTVGEARGQILGPIVFESARRVRFLEMRYTKSSEEIYAVEEQLP